MKKLLIVIFLIVGFSKAFSQGLNGIKEDSLISVVEGTIQNWYDFDHQFHTIQRNLEELIQINSKKAKPTFLKLLYYYYGLDSNFINNPQLFNVKAKLEDSLSKVAFTHLKDLKVDGIKSRVDRIKSMILLSNSNEIISKSVSPSFDFIIFVDIKQRFEQYKNTTSEKVRAQRGKENYNDIHKARSVLSQKLGCAEEKIFVKQGATITAFIDRFKSGPYNKKNNVILEYWYLLEVYGKYVINNPTPLDVRLCKALQASNFIQSDDTEFDRRRLNEVIQQIEESLKNKK